MDAEREIRGLERNEITGFSNWTWRNPFCQIRKNARLQHFEGLEEGKIIWCSNRISSTCRWISGLERCEVAGFSNVKMSHSVVRKQNCMVLKQLVNLKYFEKIISNIQRFEGLEEGKITWCSNPWCCRHDIWREMELHDAQTGFRAGTRFGSGRNLWMLHVHLFHDLSDFSDKNSKQLNKIACCAGDKQRSKDKCSPMEKR